MYAAALAKHGIDLSSSGVYWRTTVIAHAEKVRVATETIKDYRDKNAGTFARLISDDKCRDLAIVVVEALEGLESGTVI